MTQRDKLGRLKKNILGRRLNKHKGPEAGVSVACSEKERRAVWLGHREQAGAGVGDVWKVLLEIVVPEESQTMHRQEIIHMHTRVCTTHTGKEKCA